jgi:hypothetical protein
MFIELAEFLRCTGGHEEMHCVVFPEVMVGRTVIRGTVGCPVCRLEFPIEEAIVQFAPPDSHPTDLQAPTRLPVDALTVGALMGLTGPGGYAVLLGSAGLLATDLATVIGGVHFVGINAPREVEPSSVLSLVRTLDSVPLRSAMARAVVIGAEYAAAKWISESVRVLLGGLGLVVLTTDVTVEGVEQLAVGNGVWVGKKEEGRTEKQ